MGMWGEYVSVSTRRARAKKEMEQLKKKGQKIEPIEISGLKITRKFWGNKWCDHLEKFADYENRLPRGKTYVRNGSVCHLNIQQGVCEAFVSGSELYKVSIKINILNKKKWQAIKNRCSGKVGSLLELLQGKISDQVMEIVADQKEGLFPDKKEMEFDCSCPDWAGMCKHIAAVLYGIGSRLDHQPDLLFLLRGVDASELTTSQLAIETDVKIDQLGNEDLSDIFGIEFENEIPKKTSSSAILKEKKGSKKVDKTENNKKEIQKNTSKSKKVLDLDKMTGAKLQNLRKEKGYTVNALAEALGITSASIYRWEQSKAILKLQLRSKNALKKLLK